MRNQKFVEQLENVENMSIDGQGEVLRQVLSAVIGFFLSVCSICGEVSAFGVSVCAVASRSTYLAMSIGALLGYFMSSAGNVVYIVSVFLVAVVRYFFGGYKTLYGPIVTFFSLVTSAFVFMIGTGKLGFYNVLIYVSQAMMALGAAFFFWQTRKLLGKRTYYKGLSRNEITILLLSLGIVLTSIMSISLGPISLGKILSIYSILFVALNMDPQSSIIVGTVVGISILLSGNQLNGFVIMSYVLGSFFASFARNYKSVGVSSVFFIVNGTVYFLESAINKTNVLDNIFELLLASMLFILTQGLISSKIALVKNDNIDVISFENAKNLMLSKLSFASSTLSDIAVTTQRLSDQLSKSSENNIEDVYHKCAKKVCNNCQLKMFCWNTAYNDVVNSFNDMTKVLRTSGKIGEDNVSSFMKTKCVNLEEIISEVNQEYARFIASKSINRKAAEIRNVVTDQFDGMAEMLKDLAKEFHEISQFDRKATINAKKVLTDLGFNVYTVTSFKDKYGRLTIEATINLVKDIDCFGKVIAIKLSDICEKDFGIPSFIRINRNIKMTIIEKATYDIDFGVTQLSCNNVKDCGDSYNYFVDSKGKAYMILSDGMGTGSKAAVDGIVTTGLLSKLIKAGFDFEAASKIVNAALLTKSSDESLSTIDVASINLYTGQMSVFKAGAAPTFTKKSDRVLELGCTTLPAGILRGVSFDKKTISLGDRDIIVMVSDGVTNNDYDWIYSEIKSFNYNVTAKELSRKIALESKFRNKTDHDDDVTVMVGIILKGA